MNPNIRLQKYLAECGIAARRKAEKLIASGAVCVNGTVVTQLGTKIDPAIDHVTVNGEAAKPEPKKIYLKLNKPKGVISSCCQSGERTILDLVKGMPYRLYPIGRLDKDSEGLILLTNDGELANRLMHPRYGHEKEYIVNVELRITNDELMKLRSGILIEGRKILPAIVKPIGPTTFSITLKEGRKRQIRKMVDAIGNRVTNLRRIRIQNIKLGKLSSGQHIYLNENEIKELIKYN
jgi:pseudouridine synthase